MDIIRKGNTEAYNVMSSGYVQIVYFAVVLVCLLLITQKIMGEGFATSYSSGATMRMGSGFSQPTQGAEHMTSKQQVFDELQRVKRY